MPSKATKPSNRAPTNKGGNGSVFGIKISTIIVGFILLVAVLSLLYLSAWTIVAKHKYALLASAYLYTTSTYMLLLCALVTTAAVVVMIAAAWVEHDKGLKLTLAVLILTLVFEIAAGLLAFGYAVNLEERLSTSLVETIQNKYHFDKEKTRTFDQMQKRFRCCGSKSFKDWELNPTFNASMASAVPDSCCKSYEPNCAKKPYGKHPSNIFNEGCSSALHRFYHGHLVKLGYVTVGVAFLQMFTILLLAWLIKRIRMLSTMQNAAPPSTKARRLSNEITYYPIQSSPNVK